jgi:NADP-dependent 3-hydroxy acid dehydrogenase YdfG
MSKVIIVSGGTKGLGKNICNYLLSKDYKIATFGSSAIEVTSINFIQRKVNIIKLADISKFLNEVHSLWGNIDVLINNAGVVLIKPITGYTEQDINNIVDINIKGTFYLTQQSIPYLNPKGYIINIGSTRSITGAPNKSVYSMTKFALRGLTQCINSELKDIKSTILCPGLLETSGGIVSIDFLCNTVFTLINSYEKNFIPELIVGGQL